MARVKVRVRVRVRVRVTVPAVDPLVRRCGGSGVRRSFWFWFWFWEMMLIDDSERLSSRDSGRGCVGAPGNDRGMEGW